MSASYRVLNDNHGDDGSGLSSVQDQVWRDIRRFQEKWPSPPQDPESMLPPFRWSELERQLMDLAGDGGRRVLISNLLANARRTAALKPEEMVLREMLVIASVLGEVGGAD